MVESELSSRLKPAVRENIQENEFNYSNTHHAADVKESQHKGRSDEDRPNGGNCRRAGSRADLQKEEKNSHGSIPMSHQAAERRPFRAWSQKEVNLESGLTESQRKLAEMANDDPILESGQISQQQSSSGRRDTVPKSQVAKVVQERGTRLAATVSQIHCHRATSLSSRDIPSSPAKVLSARSHLEVHPHLGKAVAVRWEATAEDQVDANVGSAQDLETETSAPRRIQHPRSPKTSQSAKARIPLSSQSIIRVSSPNVGGGTGLRKKDPVAEYQRFQQVISHSTLSFSFSTCSDRT
jgi:hypothetical protein